MEGACVHAAVQIQGLWEFLVHLAMVELLGAQPLCMMLTLYSLAAQTFSQSSSSPKGWSSASLCTIGQGSWGRSPKSFIPSVCSHRIHHKAPHPGKPLSVLPVSFALLLDIICLFHKGCTWWATNLVLSRHTLDNDYSSLLAVFTWTLHKHHRKSSTAIHIDSLYNMTLRRRYIYYINTHFKLLQLKTTGCSKTSLLIIKENSSQS